MTPRRAFKLVAVAAAGVALVVGLRAWDMYQLARLPAPVRAIAAKPNTTDWSLEKDVRALASDIGPRNYAHPLALTRAETFMKKSLAAAGYAVEEQPYPVRPPGGTADVWMRNFIVKVPGARPDSPVLIIGAHYDTALETPGADDNASGSAALLELARRFRKKRHDAEIRFVAYGTEEPPFFGSKQMGSAFHAHALKAEGRKVVGMLSLEMLGYYDDAANSQKYPPPLSLFYPSRANYIAAVSNLSSHSFLRDFTSAFHPSNGLRVISASLPSWISEIGLSDHKCYWDEGFPAAIITDTSFLRYKHYHMPTDTPDRLDYARLAAVVEGLEIGINALAEPGP